jgi:hypothetical protein
MMDMNNGMTLNDTANTTARMCFALGSTRWLAKRQIRRNAKSQIAITLRVGVLSRVQIERVIDAALDAAGFRA